MASGIGFPFLVGGIGRAVRKVGVGVLGLVAAVLPGCDGLGAEQGAEVARTWEAARVYVPGHSRYYTPSTAPGAAAPLPTILFLHACVGFYWHDDQWAAILTEAGYAVVMPNSFARHYRPRDCDPSTRRVGLFPGAQNMRREEIIHAVGRLRSLPWVDSRNLFLMGHSEGAGATALWDKPGFKGHIISAWPCTHRTRPALDGVWVPAEVPVLALNFEDDPWFPAGSPMRGSCEGKFGRRKNAREVRLKGWGHVNTAQEGEAREAVLQFLRAHTMR